MCHICVCVYHCTQDIFFQILTREQNLVSQHTYVSLQFGVFVEQSLSIEGTSSKIGLFFAFFLVKLLKQQTALLSSFLVASHDLRQLHKIVITTCASL